MGRNTAKNFRTSAGCVCAEHEANVCGLRMKPLANSNLQQFNYRLSFRPQTPKPLVTLFTIKARSTIKTRMWANAQRDGRPAEYRWRPLFNAAKFG